MGTVVGPTLTMNMLTIGPGNSQVVAVTRPLAQIHGGQVPDLCQSCGGSSDSGLAQPSHVHAHKVHS